MLSKVNCIESYNNNKSKLLTSPPSPSRQKLNIITICWKCNIIISKWNGRLKTLSEKKKESSIEEEEESKIKKAIRSPLPLKNIREVETNISCVT